MSIESLTTLHACSGVYYDEIAKRIGIRPDQLESMLAGETSIRRLHAHGLDKASLALALEQRDPNLLTPLFRKQIVRIAVMLLQEAGATAEREPAKDSEPDSDLD